jgi:hypothetical protein
MSAFIEPKVPPPITKRYVNGMPVDGTCMHCGREVTRAKTVHGTGLMHMNYDEACEGLEGCYADIEGGRA